MISRKEVLRLWERRFLEKGLDSPRLSAQVLLAHVLGIDRLSMLLDSCDPVPANVLQTFEDLAWRRLQGEPVAYLVGSKEFYGLVTKCTITPIYITKNDFAWQDVFKGRDIRRKEEKL